MSHKIECENCQGRGETEAEHVEQCEVGTEGGCEICIRNDEGCPECRGYGEVDCDVDDCGECGEEEEAA